MWDFGQTERLEPEAIGAPGERTFRLRALSGGRAASIWLEKEQLAALAVMLRQLLDQTAPSEPPSQPDTPPSTAPFPLNAEVDFKIGRLGIGYDEKERTVTIFAYDLDVAEEEDTEPPFSCQITRAQCRAFAGRAEEVISAGRPLCLLCGAPLNGEGHKCLRRNGHSVRGLPSEEA